MAKLYPILLLMSALAFISCSPASNERFIENTGQAQGSTYQIKYLSPEGVDFGDRFESIFAEIDLSMSTYVPTSLISLVNKGDTLVSVDSMFIDVLNRSLEIASETNGSFDPTIGPIVSLWGFGFDEVRKDVTSEMVNDTKSKTGYQNVTMNGLEVRVPPGFNLDFNAIAQGYTVDYLAEFLEKSEVDRYMIEVGGEVRARGTNESGNVWKIGVDKPTEEIDQQDRFQFIITLENTSLATSGNYRKFWIDQETGARYSHTIDPQTGYPARNELLSASIIAPSAMDADAYATVCMVVGLTRCQELLESKSDLEGYLIYDNGNGVWETSITEGFQRYIQE
jgi:FAD:protein FMN transferase